MKKNSVKYLLSFVLALWASALSAQTHWSVSPSGYQYRMTVWYLLQDNKVNVANFNDYEVAAFVGDECRGIGTVVTDGGNTVCQLLIYSNVFSGEKVTVKCYDKTTSEEKEVFGPSITFDSDGIAGMPSSPYLYDFVQSFIPGDVDGDGEITINDVTMTISAALGRPAANFNSVAADVDGDSEITINDVTTIISMALGKI